MQHLPPQRGKSSQLSGVSAILLLSQALVPLLALLPALVALFCELILLTKLRVNQIM